MDRQRTLSAENRFLPQTLTVSERGAPLLLILKWHEASLISRQRRRRPCWRGPTRLCGPIGTTVLRSGTTWLSSNVPQESEEEWFDDEPEDEDSLGLDPLFSRQWGACTNGGLGVSQGGWFT